MFSNPIGTIRPIMPALFLAAAWLPLMGAEPSLREAVPLGQPSPIAPLPERTPSPGPISIEDVVSMTRAGIDADLIMQQIRDQGVDRTLTVPDLIYLKQQGVPIEVVKVMQQVASGRPAYAAAARTAIPPTPPQTTVIYEVVPPRPAVILAPPPRPWYYGHYHFHGGHHDRRHHSPSIGLGITFH